MEEDDRCPDCGFPIDPITMLCGPNCEWQGHISEMKDAGLPVG